MSPLPASVPSSGSLLHGTLGFAHSTTTFSPLFQTPESCSDLDNCRSVFNIAWSCVATIFACTWLALHPNIPNPQKPKGGLRHVLYHVRMMAVAVVAPEVVTLWASRQWLAARQLTTRYQEYDWTSAHAFFALMGGFTRSDIAPQGCARLKRLSPYHLEPFLQKGQIRITREEVQDRSKGDPLTKTLLLIHTTWFMIQFFTRVSKRLPVTELELVTIAFAALNFATYFFWWNKPLNVNCTVQVEDSLPRKFISSARIEDDDLINANRVSLAGRSAPCLSFMVPEQPRPQTLRTGRRLTMKNARQYFPSPRKLVKPFLRPILGPWVASTLREEEQGFLNEREVPFYYGVLSSRDSTIATVLFTCVAAGFGAVHCLAWSFPFPSQAEKYMWRISSLLITAIPTYGFIYYCLIRAHLAAVRAYSPIKCLSFTLSKPLIYLISFVPVIYILARAILLVQMFVLLRNPPDAVFVTVDWTNYIPHWRI